MIELLSSEPEASPAPGPDVTTVMVPVAVSLLVPVAVPSSLLDGVYVGENGSITTGSEVLPVIAVGESERRDEILEAVIAAGHEQIQDALQHLLSGALLYRLKHGDTHGRLWTWLGVLPESEF